MSAFAVAAFHHGLLALGCGDVEAVVWVRPAGLPDAGVDVALRVWTPQGASLTMLREVAPETGDLLAEAVRLDERMVEFAAGCWTNCPHEYELALTLPSRADGEEMLAARVEIVVAGEVAGRAAIAVTWSGGGADLDADGHTDARPDAELPTGRSPRPRHTRDEHGHAGDPCPGCGEQTAPGDHFCEGCGRELDAD